MDAIRHKHILLQTTENIVESTREWMVEEKRRQERKFTRTNSTDTSTAKSTAKADVSVDDQEGHQGAVESFSKVFMISALTGDGVQDLRVMIMEPGYLQPLFT